MRSPLPFVLILITAVPLSLAPQAEAQGPFLPRVSVGGFAGYGSGPGASAAWGVSLEIPVHPSVAIRAEYSGVDSGVGQSCVGAWPESYRCSVSGRMPSAGITVSSTPLGALQAQAQVLGGRYTRTQIGTRYSSTVLTAGAGASVRLGHPLQLRVGVRHLRPFDGDYEALMGERLRYTLATVGFEYGPVW